MDSMRKEGAVILDTRTPAEFGKGHVPDALNVDLNGGQFGTRAAWIVPPDTAVVLVAGREEDLAPAVSSLAATGQDRIEGYLVGGMQAWDAAGRPLEAIQQMSVSELHRAGAVGRQEPYCG